MYECLIWVLVYLIYRKTQINTNQSCMSEKCKGNILKLERIKKLFFDIYKKGDNTIKQHKRAYSKLRSWFVTKKFFLKITNEI